MTHPSALEELTMQGSGLPPFLRCEPVWKSDGSTDFPI